MKFKGILLTSLLALGLVSCVKNEVVPSQLIGNAQFGKESVKLANAGETMSIAVKANCDWTISTETSWIKLSPLTGTEATKDFTLTVDQENSSENPRDGYVYITTAFDTVPCDTLLVTQKGKGGIGDGKIRNAEDFLAFMDVASGATPDDKFELANDIDMEGNVLVPVTEFAGTFDGKGFKLYNFTIAAESINAAIIGVNKGTIQNLIVGSSDGKTYDGKTKIAFADGTTGAYCGIVATNSGLIDKVINFAKIEFNAATGGTDNAAGGIAGCMGTAESVISNCENYGSVSLTGNMGARASLGGVLGFSSANGATVKNCINHASVSKADDIEAEFAMGGVVGRANDALNVIECANEGAVSFDFAGSVKSYVHIGGIIGAGYKGCTFDKCMNKGGISSSINQVNRAAGIAGTLNTGATVTNCENSGDISISGVDGNANWQGIGGICGLEEKATESMPLVIKNCINNGGISATFLNNSTTHANGMAVGGIVGVTSSNATFEANTNNGVVEASNTGGGMLNVGGIFGFYRNATSGTALLTKDNTNKGKVTVKASNGAAGGIFGYDSFASDNHQGDKNQGEVSFDNAAATGSIAGNNMAKINGCIVGGKVNGVAIDGTNFGSYIQGSVSTGSAVGCMPDGGQAEPFITVDKSVKFASAGEAKTVNVTSNCAWTVSSDQAWLTANVSEGDAAVTSITLTAAENTGAERTAKVTLTCKEKTTVKAEIAITQDAAAGILVDNKITSAADLKTFIKLAPSAAPTETFTVTADINCNGAALDPAALFAATLDGQNHKIYNFTIVSETENAGLILVNTGTVKNLVIGSSNGTAYDGTTKISFDGKAAAKSAGVIAVNEGKIDNVVNFATVDLNGVTSATNYIAAGGIAGTMNAETAEITNCKNYGSVSITATLSAAGVLGGVLGYNALAGSSVKNCGNYAAIKKETKVEKEFTFAGVVGRSNAAMTIENCVNEAAVSFTFSGTGNGSYAHTAGIIGAAYKECVISSCTNKGVISSALNQVNRIGGIAGTMNTGGTVQNCKNEGAIAINQEANANWQSAGGIVGFEEKGADATPLVIKGNVNSGTVSLSLNNTSTHANCVAAGGIIGTTCSVVTYSDNTNTAKISAKNEGATAVYCGGLYGWYIKGTVGMKSSGGLNTGDVEVVAKAGAAGGVIGCVNLAGSTFTSDKSSSAITAAGLSAGALVGSNAGTFTNCAIAGSVNGTAVAAGNLETIAAGTNSGTISGTTLYSK